MDQARIVGFKYPEDIFRELRLVLCDGYDVRIFLYGRYIGGHCGFPVVAGQDLD